MNAKRRAGLAPTWLPVALTLTLLVCLSANTSLASSADPGAAQLSGAEKLIDQFRSLQEHSATQRGSDGSAELRALGRDLEAFRTTRATMGPSAAATAWLTLHDRFYRLPKAVIESYDDPYSQAERSGVNLLGLLEALPPPSSWPALRAALYSKERKSVSDADNRLRVLVNFLLGDREGVDLELKKLREDMGVDRLGSLRRSNLAQRQPSNGGDKLRRSAEAFSEYLLRLESVRGEGRVRVVVPDLVSIAGQTRSEELIRRALKLPGVSINVPSGGPTLALAKKIVKTEIKTLLEPQWDLVTGIGDVELYEALAHRFPEPAAKGANRTSFEKRSTEFEYAYRSPGESSREIARVHYLLGLLALGRSDEASALAGDIDAQVFQNQTFERAWRAFDKGRYSSSINRFCQQILSRRPELSLWSHCAVVAAAQRQGDQVLKLARAALVTPGKSATYLAAMQHRVLDVLLALDRVDEALAELRRAATGREYEAPDQAAQGRRLKFALRLGTLGHALDRESVIGEAEIAVLAILSAEGSKKDRSDDFSREWGDSNRGIAEFVEILLRRGRYGSAERILNALFRESTMAATLGKDKAYLDAVLLQGYVAGPVAQLAQVYDAAGRSQDVLTLLDKFGGWGTRDLIGVADRFPGLMVPAARALRSSGRAAVAINVLKLHLQAAPQDDEAFALICGLLGLDAVPWLDALYSRDRFEERPLIWKAQLLLEAGKLDRAEATIRQALKVDPTDGEQRAGDRARSYSVLAAVLRAKGKAEDAAFFDKVVEAVRLAEAGDRLSNAGLIKRSLETYEKASWLFADAYCVQWRLAERLVAVGSLEEARKHYQIAFERMPEQFGQAANLCFGCEGVFTHAESMSVAEEVLTRLAKVSPDKPQVHYLLGQLRGAQGRMVEAYDHYRRATLLDPQYLDGWREAYKLRHDVLLSADETNEIAIKLLSLDPMGRHGADPFDDVSDMATLWSIFDQAAARNLEIPNALYPLGTSRLAIEDYQARVGSRFDPLAGSRPKLIQARSAATPGAAVAKVGFVRRLLGVRQF